MFNVTRHERHLFFVLFAHFLVAPFIVISVAYTFIITTGRKFVHLKMHFFCQNIKMLPFVDGHDLVPIHK